MGDYHPLPTAEIDKDLLKALFSSLFNNHPNTTLAVHSESIGETLVKQLECVIGHETRRRDLQIDPTQCTMTGYGYIHGFEATNKKSMFIVRLSLITGRLKPTDEMSTRYRFQNMQLLLDRKFNTFAESLAQHDVNPYKKQLMKLSIHQPHFDIYNSDKESKLNTMGIFKELSIV